MQDQMDAQGCLDTLEKDHKFFHSCMDNLLIWDYTKFYAYFLMNNRTKTKAQYERVIKLKDVKVKGTKISTFIQLGIYRRRILNVM